MNHSHNMAGNCVAVAHKDLYKPANKANYMADNFADNAPPFHGLMPEWFRFCHKDKRLFAHRKKAQIKLYDKKLVSLNSL